MIIRIIFSGRTNCEMPECAAFQLLFTLAQKSKCILHSFQSTKHKFFLQGLSFISIKRRQKIAVWCTLNLQRLNRGPALRIKQSAFIRKTKRWMLFCRRLVGFLIFWDRKLSLWVNVSNNETIDYKFQPI